MDDRRRQTLIGCVLLGTIGFLACFTHVQEYDRVWHQPMAWWDYLVDVFWVTAFVAASVVGLRSDLRYRGLLATLLAGTIVWRIFGESGRGPWAQLVDVGLIMSLWVVVWVLGGGRLRNLPVRWLVVRWVVHCAAWLLIAGVMVALWMPRDPPVSPAPKPNGYDDFLRAAAAIRGNLPDHASVETLRSVISQNAEAFALVQIGLSKRCRVSIEVSEDWGRRHLKDLGRLKRLNWYLAARGRLAHLEGRTEEALDAYAEAYRYAHQALRGGLLVDFCNQIAFKKVALAHFETIFPRLTPPQCRGVLELLEETEATQESARTVVARQERWDSAAIPVSRRVGAWLSDVWLALRIRSFDPLVSPSSIATRVQSQYRSQTLAPILDQLRARSGSGPVQETPAPRLH